MSSDACGFEIFGSIYLFYFDNKKKNIDKKVKQNNNQHCRSNALSYSATKCTVNAHSLLLLTIATATATSSSATLSAVSPCFA